MKSTKLLSVTVPKNVITKGFKGGWYEGWVRCFDGRDRHANLDAETFRIPSLQEQKFTGLVLCLMHWKNKRSSPFSKSM